MVTEDKVNRERERFLARQSGGRGNEATTALPRSMMHLNCLLHAIRCGVLVVADDLSTAQREEVSRELSMMVADLNAAYETTGIHRLPGTSHFLRDDDDWDGQKV